MMTWMYRQEDHTMIKDFIKWGFKFVNFYQNGEYCELVQNDMVEETLEYSAHADGGPRLPSTHA